MSFWDNITGGEGYQMTGAEQNRLNYGNSRKAFQDKSRTYQAIGSFDPLANYLFSLIPQINQMNQNKDESALALTQAQGDVDRANKKIDRQSGETLGDYGAGLASSGLSGGSADAARSRLTADAAEAKADNQRQLDNHKAMSDLRAKHQQDQFWLGTVLNLIPAGINTALSFDANQAKNKAEDDYMKLFPTFSPDQREGFRYQ